MLHRTVSWTRIDRAGRDARPTIPAGLLGARALIQFSARTRPLATAGRYDRAAIMAAACAAAAGIQERCGVSRREAMSSALKAAWQVAILVDRRYRQLPDEPQPGAIEPWEAVAPVRPDTAHSRSLRFLDVGAELLAAVAIIGGGMVLTGFVSLL